MNTSEQFAAATVATALSSAALRLRSAGVGDARREAVQLWSTLYDVPPGDTWLRRGNAIAPEDLAGFQAVVDRRVRGVPAAYATGRAAFRHLVLAIDQRVLIPRPETEGLVEHVLAGVGARDDVCGLEIGVGSGAVIVSLAVEGRFRHLVGTDISADALAVARANARVHAPDQSIEWRLGDLFAPVAGERFDVVVANPPYIAPSEYANLDASVRAYEPRIALESDDHGMRHIARICAAAADHLTPAGHLILEVDARRAQRAARAARDSGLTGVRVERDVFGRDRYLLAQCA